jgi:hypothetical protein
MACDEEQLMTASFGARRFTPFPPRGGLPRHSQRVNGCARRPGRRFSRRTAGSRSRYQPRAGPESPIAARGGVEWCRGRTRTP